MIKLSKRPGFPYDSLRRLRHASSAPNAARTDMNSDLTWTLDGVGNWTTVVQKLNNTNYTCNRTANRFNEYSEISTTDQVHDSNGNLSGEDGTAGDQYYYDAFNRLRIVEESGSSPSTDEPIAIYAYDALNRRIRKQTPDSFTPADGSSPPSGQCDYTDFYYDGWRVIEEREALNDTAFYGSERYIETHATFINSYDIDYTGYLYCDYLGTTYNGFSYTRPTTSYARQFVYGNYIDEAIVLDVLYSNGSLEARYFYHHDAQYSVAGLTNASGVLIEAYQYDPYGKHVVLTKNGSAIGFDTNDTRTVNGTSDTDIGTPYTFTGRRLDAETGLHYFRNRYYSTARGRFISRDPIGYVDGANLYGYVGGNPLKYLDPSGKVPFPAMFCGALALGNKSARGGGCRKFADMVCGGPSCTIQKCLKRIKAKHCNVIQYKGLLHDACLISCRWMSCTVEKPGLFPPVIRCIPGPIPPPPILP